jgi:hypothetical protein
LILELSGKSPSVLPSISSAFTPYRLFQKKPEKGREAAAPSNIKEIQEIQGGQEAPLDGDAINPKDA